MPRDDIFDKYPSFPENIAVAELSRLSLWKLLENDAHESEELFRACKETGFFLLDLTASNAGETVLNDADNAFKISREIFDIDQEEQAKYPFELGERFLYGFKQIGEMKLEDGSPDNVEIYAVRQDDMLASSTTRPYLPLVKENRKTFQDIFLHTYDIICHLMSHLDKHLDLRPGTLAALCPQDKPSPTLLRLLKSPPAKIGSSRTNLIGHNDIGSMTMLFNKLGGLQTLPAGSESIEANWVYVRPQPGCAIINLGDAMVQWSGGILRSNIHRVTTPPGQQAGCERYSVAYLLRPAAEASMQRLKGGGVIPQVADGEQEEGMCAKDWEIKQRALIAAGNALPKSKGSVG